MELLLTITGIILFIIVIMLVIKSKNKVEPGNTDFSNSQQQQYAGTVKQVPRDHVAYKEKQDGVMVAIMKAAPKTIMRTVLLLLITHFLTGYFSIRNSERLAMVGSDISQGDYISAVVSLFTIEK